MSSIYLLLLIFSIFRLHRWDAHALATSAPNDFSYMRAVSNATELPLKAEYDYIVVGGGTAGCPLAATLSQNYSVLVLERGATPSEYPDVLLRSRQTTVLSTPDSDGKGPVQQFTSLDGVDNARGRILGGTSMINAAIYSRADPGFYLKSGLHWDPSKVEQAYRWVEDSIVYGSASFPWEKAFVNASLEAGVLPNNGFRVEHLVGTKVSGSTFDQTGRRHGAVELLNRGVLERNNLRVGVGAYVERILFSSPTASSGLTAIGVKYRDSRGRSHRATVRSKGEVIVSAGAIGSPQLLLLSGVGPAPQLISRGIPVVLPQINVGKFMADNPRNPVRFIPPFTLPPSYVQAIAIAPEFHIETYAIASKFELSGASSSSLTPALKNSTIDLSIVEIGSEVPGPTSNNGLLTLALSNNVKDNPNVRFNYFSNASDLAVCVKALRKIGDILGTKTLSSYKFDNRDVRNIDGYKFFGTPLPIDYITNDVSLEKFCRTTVATWWHYHGGCVAGKVVDSEFKVIGIKALRVVDASVYTVSPGTNPQATIMMMGRYVALNILQQRMR